MNCKISIYTQLTLIAALVITFSIVDPKETLGASCSINNWCIVNSLPQTQSFFGIWGTSSSNIYVVGEDLIMRFNGSLWTNEDPAGGVNHKSIWGSQENDIYAVGNGGSRYHFNGTSWANVEVVNTNARFGIWGIDNSNVYIAAGHGTLHYYNGTYWEILGVDSSLSDCRVIWGTSDTNIFVVTSQWDLASGEFFHNIKHYNGSHYPDGSMLWSTVYSISLPGMINAIWGSSGSDVYLVGVNGIIIHFNGYSWENISSGTTNSLNAIWGSSDSDIYIAGDSGLIMHFNGDQWVNSESGTTNNLYAIWGSSSKNIYVAGANGTVIHKGAKSFQWNLLLSAVIKSGNHVPFTLPSDGTNDYNQFNDPYKKDDWLSEKYHTGIDYDDNSSLDIRATSQGKIVWLEVMNSNDHGMGSNIIIEHLLRNNTKIYSSYSHLESFPPNIKLGSCVNGGDIIGQMGTSGYGVLGRWPRHLHFEIKQKPVTGTPVGDPYWGYTPTPPYNYGYFDPSGYLGIQFAKKHPGCNR